MLRDQFTIAELNDLNNYLAWNIWDVLVMRATEGVSGMIPRQEYEILAFMHEFYRWPEILRMTTDEIGAQGVMDIGATARTEIGTKINCVHDWCIGAVGFGMGRCGLLALEAIQPERLHRGKQRDPQVHAARAVGQAPGRLDPQLAGRLPLPDPREADFLATDAQLERLEQAARRTTCCSSSTPPPSCCRSWTTTTAGSGWATPVPTRCRTASILIMRDLFINEEAFHWSDVCDTRTCRTATRSCSTIDPKAMGLRRDPRQRHLDHVHAAEELHRAYVEAGAVFVREKWNTPMSEVYPVKIKDLEPRSPASRQATLKLYTKTSRMSAAS